MTGGRHAQVCLRGSLGAVVLALSLCSPAFGQETSESSEAAAERRQDAPLAAQEIRSVERGLFLEMDFGAGYLVTELDDRSFGLALVTGAFIGYDIIPVLSVSLGARALAVSGRFNPDEPAPRGDLFYIMPMAQVQFAVLTTERNFLWIRGAGGFGLGLPGEIDGLEFGGNGPTFGGYVGYERFTKLRHFSVGVQAGAVFVTQPGFGVAITVTPTVKYTF